MNERTLPYNQEAEMGGLGAMLLDGTNLASIAVAKVGLKSESFYMPAHRRIFEAIDVMAQRGDPIDALTVATELEKGDYLEVVGGMDYLNKLLAQTPTAAHGEYYLRIVRQKWILRKIIQECLNVESEAVGAEDADAFLGGIPQRFVELTGGIQDEKNNEAVMMESVGEWRRARDEEGYLGGLSTPWPRFDERVGGLKPGLIIIAGRPSQGKTTMEQNIALWNAKDGNPVLRVTLDLTRKRLLARAISMKAGVSLPKLNAGYAGESQLVEAEEAAKTLGAYQMVIDDRHRVIAEICSQARAAKLRHGIKLMTLDYIQEVCLSESDDGFVNENLELTRISRKLKALAVDMSIPVIAVSQLSRESEKGDRPPQLSDLRGSGSLEQDASVVILLSKNKKIAEIKQVRRPVWVDIAKNQDGETGELAFWLRPHYFRFDEAEEDFADAETGLPAPRSLREGQAGEESNRKDTKKE